MLDEDLNTRALERGALLWHYTNFAGLKGILAGTFWASSLPYLNDTEEFRYGLNIALEVLHNQLSMKLRELSPVGSAIHSEVESFFLDRYQPRDVFVASLSTEKDDLSQWRAYGGAGPLFSIGFDPQRLERRADEALFALDEVQYGRTKIVADLTLALIGALDPLVEEIHSTEPDVRPGRVQAWAESLAGELLVLIPRYKDPKFGAEKEWRLIRRESVVVREPALDVEFRQSGSLIVPYLAMPLHSRVTQKEFRESGKPVDTPIARIAVGPSPHPDELEHAVREMAERHGIAVDVEGSAVPFRNW